MKKVGTILFEQGSVDVTDPCYNNNYLFGKHTKIKIKPGLYNCYVYKWETHITAIEIKRKGYVSIAGNYQSYDSIGVDAGLAGFFENKKDYSNEEWKLFCHDLNIEDRKDPTKKYYFKDNGFFSKSGFGDGVYDVFIKKNTEGEIVQVKIKFLW